MADPCALEVGYTLTQIALWYNKLANTLSRKIGCPLAQKIPVCLMARQNTKVSLVVLCILHHSSGKATPLLGLVYYRKAR